MTVNNDNIDDSDDDVNANYYTEDRLFQNARYSW